jgi:L-glyceraldehyde 3-phosphate reductase
MKRYESGMIYNRCGRSGLQLPAVSRDPWVTSVLVGTSSADQMHENIGALRNTVFFEDELAEIEAVLADA